MKRSPLVPTIDPCTLVALIHRCIPDDGPTKDTELRQLTREMDAVQAEVRRAEVRRYVVEAA